MGDALHKWAPIAISIVSLLVATSSLFFTWRQFNASKEALLVEETSKVPGLTVQKDSKNGSAELVARFELRVSNLSSDAASITDLRCEVGNRTPPDSMAVSLIFSDQCILFFQGQGGEAPVSGPVNIGAKNSVGIVVVARYPASDKARVLLSSYLAHDKFDDEKFLLFLAANKTDFFGTEFPRAYGYLQKTFGQYLCLGGSVALSGRSSLHSAINWVEDFYVGPIIPAVNCEGRRVVVLQGSEPFRSDLFDPATAPF